MITAAECRRQSTLYMQAAKDEEDAEIRTAIVVAARSWTSTANQLDRLAELRKSRWPR